MDGDSSRAVGFLFSLVGSKGCGNAVPCVMACCPQYASELKRWQRSQYEECERHTVGNTVCSHALSGPASISRARLSWEGFHPHLPADARGLFKLDPSLVPVILSLFTFKRHSHSTARAGVRGLCHREPDRGALTVIPRRSCQPRLLPSSHFRCRLQALRISSTRDTSILKIEGTRMLPRAGMPGRDEIPTRFSPVERCHACDLVNLRGARGFRVDSKTPQS